MKDPKAENVMAESSQQKRVIFRCGWCGLPVNEDGSLIASIKNNLEANTYLYENKDAIQKHVNGECCPNGDE